MNESAERAARLVAEAEHVYSMTKRRKEALRTAEAQALAATGESAAADGSVRVTVDAAGMLTGLVLTPGALRATPEDLARLVVTVSQEAAARARAAVRDVYEPLRGEGIVRGIPVLLPPPPFDAPPPRPPRKQAEEEAPYEERSITRRRGRP
ncbi:YbaB/EbfC family nucleoid-associated protein [Actinophytocola sp. KF-1]